jgi:hypothetical protein
MQHWDQPGLQTRWSPLRVVAEARAASTIWMSWSDILGGLGVTAGSSASLRNDKLKSGQDTSIIIRLLFGLVSLIRYSLAPRSSISVSPFWRMKLCVKGAMDDGRLPSSTPTAT